MQKLQHASTTNLRLWHSGLILSQEKDIIKSKRCIYLLLCLCCSLDDGEIKLKIANCNLSMNVPHRNIQFKKYAKTKTIYEVYFQNKYIKTFSKSIENFPLSGLATANCINSKGNNTPL